VLLDFIEPSRAIRASLLGGSGHYEKVVQAVLGAKVSVWIATANLKELYVEGPRRPGKARRPFRSVLDAFAELAAQGVELRVLHAGFPSTGFRQGFDSHPALVGGGLTLKHCPRVHLKTVIVDGRSLYLGSANWTGAGLGKKSDRKRNFELGLWSEDEVLLDHVQALYEHLWQGGECKTCALRDVPQGRQGCPDPIVPAAQLVRKRAAPKKRSASAAKKRAAR
jgi:phosphatidylserine/phosphatidylglycerophosphate/cardiolipin synthase-like enzyme